MLFSEGIVQPGREVAWLQETWSHDFKHIFDTRLYTRIRCHPCSLESYTLKSQCIDGEEMKGGPWTLVVSLSHGVSHCHTFNVTCDILTYTMLIYVQRWNLQKGHRSKVYSPVDFYKWTHRRNQHVDRSAFSHPLLCFLDLNTPPTMEYELSEYHAVKAENES